MIEKALNKVTVIMPEIIDDDFQEARRYLREGNLESAFTKFLKLREKRSQLKHSEASNFYLKFLLKADQLNEKIITKRIKYLQKAVSDNPSYADLHYELAVAYTLLSRFIHGKAIEEYKKALLINPAFDKADKNLKIAKNEIMGFDLVIKNVLKE
jgi:tetratricopeptide (TPR) repeat protein